MSPPSKPAPPTKIAVCLFPGFQLLDITGPLDILNQLSVSSRLDLHILAATLDPVTTAHALSSSVGSNFAQCIVPTHTFDTAPQDLDVVIVPGGFGTRVEENVGPVREFVSKWYGGGDGGGKGSEGGNGEGKRNWLLSVCTGSAVLASAGVLDGRRATTNKKRFNDVKAQYPKVDWVPKARWVVDGDIWTSSGISAGIDLILGWVAHVWDEETALLLADASEYEWNRDADNDRFAERWGAV